MSGTDSGNYTTAATVVDGAEIGCDNTAIAANEAECTVVVGGGNAGFETAAQLLAYTKSVTLLHHGDKYRADPVTVEKVLANDNISFQAYREDGTPGIYIVIEPDGSSRS